MDSDDRKKFWAAIRNSPEDDTPRLVYADWLQEQGEEERAEFIRVQCALDKLGPDRRRGRKERVWLEPREKAILASHGAAWRAPFRDVLHGSNRWATGDRWLAELKFRRGFLNGNQLGLESVRRIAAAGDAVEPVDQIQMAECGAEYRHESVLEIARWHGAGCVVWFSIAWGTDADIAEFVRSEHLHNLRHLGVWHGKVTDRGLSKLAAWPHAAKLASMDLKDNPITDAGAYALADSPHIGTLRRLDLHNTQIGPEGRKRLRVRFGEAVVF
jgi:uncharacterized protein (TIGR02996 family)